MFPVPGQDSPVMFVRTQNVRRESEGVLSSVQRASHARDLLTLPAGQLGPEPVSWGSHRGEDTWWHHFLSFSCPEENSVGLSWDRRRGIRLPG